MKYSALLLLCQKQDTARGPADGLQSFSDNNNDKVLNEVNHICHTAVKSS